MFAAISLPNRPNKDTTLLGGVFVWLGNRDSNPNRQSQSLQCYLYTIPQYLIALLPRGTIYIIHGKAGMSTEIFKIFQKMFEIF